MSERKNPKGRKKRINTGVRPYKPAVKPKPFSFGGLLLAKRFRFAVAFAFFCFAFYVTVQLLPAWITKPVSENTAWTLGKVLNALGVPASTVLDTVSYSGLTFVIVTECTPIFSAGLFLGCILFYPATLREKLTGLLAGIPLLYLGNLARLTATFMISLYDRKLFELAHVYLGQVFTIFLVIAVCITWLNWLDRKASEPGSITGPGGFLIRFALISSGVFFAWVLVQHRYIWFLDKIVTFGFSLFHYRIALARKTHFYFETFSIVCFVSVLLAMHSISRSSKIKTLSAGLALLFLMHLFHRIDNVLVAYFHYSAMFPIDLTLLIVGQYLLPVLLVIVLPKRLASH